MGEDRIFYSAGFKSYDITRRYSDSEVWFDWIERSRYLTREVTISINVMKWLVFVFNAATEEKRKTVKRWNMKDHFSEFFCTLKYNESGRYISFIAIHGEVNLLLLHQRVLLKRVGEI